MKLVADKQLEVEGIALVTVHADGKITVDETGDHLGRKGMKIGGRLGLVVGLLSPPLLAATVVGAAAGGLVGRFAKHKVESGLGEKMGAALPRLRRHRRDLRPRKGRHGQLDAHQRSEEIDSAGNSVFLSRCVQFGPWAGSVQPNYRIT